ncbi:MAG: antitermination protein Q [Pseudomonadales bacterium]|nr:antitermination protein Q [Pseudomonadales bacterium]
MAFERSTEQLLEQWGLWVTQGSSVSACQSPGMRPLAAITDEEALTIDGLVGRLGKRYPEAGEVLLRYYTSGCSLMDVGHRMRVGETKARQMLNAGIAWVDGALEPKRLAA